MIEHSIDSSLHLLEVRLTGSVSLLDLVNFVVRAQKDLQYGPSLKTLFVVDQAAEFERLTPESLSTFFRRVEVSGGAARWAIVAPHATHNSIFSSAVQNFSSQRLKIRVFDDEFPALQWLSTNDATG